MILLNRVQRHTFLYTTGQYVLLVMCYLVVFSSSAWAQKSGGSTSNTLPTVTIVVQTASFEYRPDLGGVYDRTRGIVWGYSLTGFANSGASYAGAVLLGSNYGARLEKAGDDSLALYDYQVTTRGIGDPTLLEAAEKLWAAADVAGQSTNWRLPTITEARDAVSRGLFTYGEGGLNMWTGSPADVEFGLPYGGILTWTSSTAKHKGNDCAWAFAPHDGGARLAGIGGSSLDAIMIRNYTGP